MQKIILSLLLTLCCFFSALPGTGYAYSPKPAAFVVLDHSGNLTPQTYKDWNSIVKLIYHIPQHKLETTKAIEEVVASALLTKKVKVDKALMQELALKTEQDVLVIANIRAMNVIQIPTNHFWDNHDDYFRVTTIADLYVYHKENDRFSKKELWQDDVKAYGGFDQPEYTIKWALSKLINTNEGVPVIQ